MKVNNRWFQLVASLIAMIMIANLQYAWTLFVKPIQAGSGWKLSSVPSGRTTADVVGDPALAKFTVAK